ncbi:hypothetical protein BDV33DRAFT_206751 [Aspergillus novoparasiticus]|uniref:Uncharacterized protein n=1 Tax=Aspergillus novoparasiticus TaxID=986946 RepID=A0A5N6EIK3_9EURO|nr:hypothetical protein BDV33DRAFT_206751 [Aspergillus novoparasiticus]
MSSLFYTNVDRGAKHYQIPNSLTAERTVEILHNHRLLAGQIWPSMMVKVTDSNVIATTVVVESATSKFNATFTSLENGVSFQEEAVMGFGVQIQWTVVDRCIHSASQLVDECLHSNAVLEENVRFSSLRIVDRFLNFVDDFNPKTKCLIELLEKVASGEISMRDIRVISRGYGDTERLKGE